MIFKEIDSLGGCLIQKNEPLKNHTSFKVGGPADRLVTVYNSSQLKELLGAVRRAGLPMMVLGNGSNILASDLGYRGVILKLDGDFTKISCEGNRLIAGSGAKLSAVCQFARDHELTGLEFAYGIPGSAGGALYMNAGAYGGEMKDVVFNCSCIYSDGHEETFSLDQMELSYRHSRFQQEDCIITEISVELAPGRREEIAQQMEEFMTRRKAKQPYDLPSGGSTFKRPEGHFAAQLIEECGLKGCSVGGAQVSEKHAGFVVNKGGASCRDILELVNTVKQKVFTDKKVSLECEIRMIGEGI